jgi:hypothetical protein
MKELHRHIDRHAERAKVEIIKDKHRALAHINGLLERYRLEDLFKRRSEGQKLRFANFRKFNGGGK